jgi:hypothetical protein
VIDLVRFAASLYLAGERHHDPKGAEAAVTRLFQGYQRGVEHPDEMPDDPPMVQRVRAKFTTDRAEFFRWVDSISAPVDSSTAAAIVGALAPYAAAIRSAEPALPAGYFDIAKIAQLRIGIGSALDRKFLVRVSGPTDDPNDDVHLELKEVRDLRSISCLDRANDRTAMRSLVGHARLAYQPSRLLGYVSFGGREYWVHAWASSYHELTIDEAGAGEDLAAIAFDVGVQLGKGHPKDIATPFDAALRRDLSQFVTIEEEGIHKIAKRLAQQTIDAWERFRAGPAD